MSNEIDPGLRRLFAATAEQPADEAFVSAASARTSRERRTRLVLQAAGLLVAALVLAIVAAALGPVLGQLAGLLARWLSGSPVGWVAGLALAAAGFLCVRLLAPLAAWRR